MAFLQILFSIEITVCIYIYLDNNGIKHIEIQKRKRGGGEEEDNIWRKLRMV
jgi:hypothetical protein